ncbi:MAG: hypothetical protein ABIN95_03915 [Mucilaginibacter sp.]
MKQFKVALNIFFLLIIAVGCNNIKSKKANEYCSHNRSENPEITKNIKLFFEKYRSDGPVKAVDFISATNKLISSGDQIASLKVKLDSLHHKLGNYRGYGQITRKYVADDLYLCSYLVKYERQPLRFVFIFYRPDKNWILQSFSFDTDVVSELEESGKIYLIE